MNRRMLLLLPISLLLLLLQPLTTGCQAPREPHLLLQADSLCSSRPDSALRLLHSLTPTLEHSPEHTRMYHTLLLIKAADKAYQRHTTDTLILPVVAYYEHHRTSGHLPEAYYYAGRVYADLHDAPKALDYFQKALLELSVKDNAKLRVVINSQMCDLLVAQGLYNEALEIYQDNLQIDSLANDSVGLFYDYRDIGFTLAKRQDSTKAIVCYHHAKKIAHNMKNESYTNAILFTISRFYMGQLKLDSAKKYLTPAMNNIGWENEAIAYSLAGELSYHLGKMDSAAFYFNKLLEVNGYGSKRMAHQGLSILAIKNNRVEEAIKHFQQYRIYNDSIEQNRQTEVIAKMQSLYNYNRYKDQALQLKSQQEKIKLSFLWYILISIALLVSVLTYILYRKKKSKEELTDINTLLEKQRQVTISIEKLYQEAKKKIESLSDLSQAIDLRNNKDTTDLYTTLRQTTHERIKGHLEFMNLLKQMEEKANNKNYLKPEDWDAIITLINEIYPLFINNLRTLHPVNETELHICLLVKLGFQPIQISTLSGQSAENVSSVRRRLYQKVYGKKGKPSDWDAVLNSL